MENHRNGEIHRIGRSGNRHLHIIGKQFFNLFLKAGEFFGEIGLLEQRKRTAAVIALAQCHLLELKATDFWELADQHPSLRDNIAAVAKARVAELESGEQRSK